MKISFRHWLLLALLSILSIAVWFKFTYPQFALTDFSTSRTQALTIAEKYLVNRSHINVSQHQKVAVFISDTDSDRYLQKAIGFKGEREFIAAHEFNLFYWVVRFFKENQKEEFRCTISAATGQIMRFQHVIEDTEAREISDEETAKQTAVAFLKDQLGVNPSDYTFHSKHSRKYDNRMDHSFSWEKNNVYIPWNRDENSGGAKLTINVTISGQEVLAFSKNVLEIPEKFTRAIQQQIRNGQNLSMMFTVFYIILVVAATYFVILRRNHLVMHAARYFVIGLTITIFCLCILGDFNEFEYTLFRYDTASSLQSYLLNYFLHFVISIFLVSVVIMMPALAGESLRHEVAPEKKECSFVHYITSTFFSRAVAQCVGLGYLVFLVMLGIQSLAFEFGQKYLGVWIEHSWMTQITSTYLPFLSAFILAFQASFTEEIVFRIFAINWIRKLTRNTFGAIVISSIVWGFGHSYYLVFPVWFRGLEVACLGVFLSLVYLKFGIIPVLVGHYVFDVFWGIAGFLFGKTSNFNFFSSAVMMLVPCFIGIIAYIKNRPETENALRWRLNRNQIYNLEILTTFLKSNPETLRGKSSEEIRQDLISHNWDMAVLDHALKNFRNR